MPLLALCGIHAWKAGLPPLVEKRVKKPKVLVLEDEVIIGMDIEAFLWDEGFEVMLATDCDVAIQWLTAESPMSLSWTSS